MAAADQHSLANFASMAVLAADDRDAGPATPCLTCGAPAPTSMVNPDPTKDWIEIKLVDKQGYPVAFEPYAVKIPSGEIMQGSLDEDGFARIDGIDPGNCDVTFPNLDGDLWRRK